MSGTKRTALLKDGVMSRVHVDSSAAMRDERGVINLIVELMSARLFFFFF